MGAFTAIDELARVRFLASACVAQRSGRLACDECVTACPALSLHWSDKGPGVESSCIGCGRCAAVCPSGALSVAGFNHPAPLPDRNTVSLECWKVPISASTTSSVRVPCLGGVSAAQWLSLVEAANGRLVVVVDRGWCCQCGANLPNQARSPWARTLNPVREILTELDWPQARQPRVHLDPLPARLMPSQIPSDTPPSLARRSFFRKLGHEAQRVVGVEDKQQGQPSPRALKAQRMPMPQREQLLASARQLSRAEKRPMPAAPYQALTLSTDCDHNGVCAGVCPSGALALFEDAEGVGLQFDAERCLDCGLCVKSCPHQALVLTPASVAPALGHPQRISTHGERTCQHCRQRFYGAAHASTCPDCKRKRQLGAALFGTPLATDKLSLQDFPTGGKQDE